MGLKAVQIVAAYLVGIALIATGIGFFDWRIGVASFGAGLVVPILALPRDAVREERE